MAGTRVRRTTRGLPFIFAEPLTLSAASNGLCQAYLHVSEVATTNSFVAQSLVSYLAGVLLLGGLVGLYARQAEAAGKLGLVGFLVAFFCTALLLSDFYANFLTTPAVALAAPEFLDSAFGGMLKLWFSLEFGFFALGWLLFGIATLRAGVYPRGVALLLVIGAVLALLPLPQINIVGDLALAWLGIALIRERTT